MAILAMSVASKPAARRGGVAAGGARANISKRAAG